MGENGIYKMSEDQTQAIFKQMGSAEANYKFLFKILDELKEKVDKLQEELFRIKLTAEITKVKLMVFGSVGGFFASFGLYLIKTFILEV